MSALCFDIANLSISDWQEQDVSGPNSPDFTLSENALIPIPDSYLTAKQARLPSLHNVNFTFNYDDQDDEKQLWK